MPIVQDTPNTLYIREARLSFPNLLAPHASAPNARPRYAATFIMDPSDQEWAEFSQIMNQMFQEKWGEHAGGIAARIAQDRKLRCYGFGQEKLDNTGQILNGFQDKVFITALRKEEDGRPKFYGPDAQEAPPTAPLNEWFAGGNYVAGVVSFWLQENEHGRAIRAQLVGLQYLREGEKFGTQEADAGAIFQPVPGAPAATAAAPGMPAAPAMPTAAPAAPAAPAMPAAAPAAPAMPPMPTDVDPLG